MPATPVDPTEALGKEAKQRLADCRQKKSLFRDDFEEAYFFTAPHRQRDMTAATATGRSDETKPNDASELSTSIGFEASEDFATELESSFTPKGLEWVAQKPSATLEKQVRNQIAPRIKEQSAAVFAAIRESNFHDAAASVFVPDAGIGTVGMWIDDERAPAAIQCRGCPLPEIEVNIGPDGYIDDRFLVRPTRYRHLPALLPGVKLPEETAKKVRDKPNDKCQVSWGFWRVWERRDDIVWQGVIRIGEKPVAAAVYEGAGSCPFIVARFGATPLLPFGIGPTVQALPELRSLDEASLSVLERLDIATNPPFGYPDDGVVNFEGGIQAGMGYPMRSGSGQDFTKLFFEGDVDLSYLGRAELERRIKRLHFSDKPEQRGDTPPTATQWLDEIALAQRRIGTPGQGFWREFCGEVFLRFRYLLMVRGTLPAVEIDGRALALEPYNPAEKARELQEAETGVRLLGIIGQSAPQLAALLVNYPKTFEALKQKMGDEIVELNDEEAIKAAVEQFASVLGESQGNLQARGEPQRALR